MEKTEKINFTNFTHTHTHTHARARARAQTETERERESGADRQTERRHGLFAHIN